jgi:hypothetical protein
MSPSTSRNSPASSSPFVTEQQATNFWKDLNPTSFPTKLRSNDNLLFNELKKCAHLASVLPPCTQLYPETLNMRFPPSSKRRYMSAQLAYTDEPHVYKQTPSAPVTELKPTGNSILEFVRSHDLFRPGTFESKFPGTSFPHVTLIHSLPRIDKTIFSALFQSVVRKTKAIPEIKSLKLKKLPAPVTLALTRMINASIKFTYDQKTKSASAHKAKKTSSDQKAKGKKTASPLSSADLVRLESPQKDKNVILTKSAKRRARKARAKAMTTFTGFQEPLPPQRKQTRFMTSATPLPPTNLTRTSPHDCVTFPSFNRPEEISASSYPYASPAREALSHELAIRSIERLHYPYHMESFSKKPFSYCFECQQFSLEPCVLTTTTTCKFNPPAPATSPTSDITYPVRQATLMLRDLHLVMTQLSFDPASQLVNSDRSIANARRLSTVFCDPSIANRLPETGLAHLYGRLFGTTNHESRVHVLVPDSLQEATLTLSAFQTVDRALQSVLDCLKYDVRFD